MTRSTIWGVFGLVYSIFIRHRILLVVPTYPLQNLHFASNLELGVLLFRVGHIFDNFLRTDRRTYSLASAFPFEDVKLRACQHSVCVRVLELT